jgi:hypothetical protein
MGADLSRGLADRGALRLHRHFGRERRHRARFVFYLLVIFVVLLVLGLMAGRWV